MRQHNSFNNSGLGRSKPQRHAFRSFINDNFKRKRSQMGLVEDRTSSTTIVRIIIGLLMLHLVIIGGVLLKGHFDKLAGGVVVPPSMTPPPPIAKPVLQAEEAQAAATPVLPAPTAPAAPVASSTASSATHITQPSAETELFPEDESAVAVAPAPTAPVVVTPPVAPAQPASTPAPAAPAVAMTTVKHLINSGDTWYGIASEYGISIDALKAANPASARRSHLYQGNYLNVPVPADSPAAKAAAAATKVAAAPAAATYTVRRGDTLARIARKHKMSVNALMKLNGLTAKDARNIKVGMELKVGK